MNIFYPLKKAIISNKLNKKRKDMPLSYDEAELYQLKGNEPWNVNNSYFFGGYSYKEKTSLVLRLGIRNNLPYEIFFFYKNKEMFLVTPNDYYDESPIEVKCLIPEKTWEVTFNDKLLDKSNNSLHDVKASFVFEARREIFDFFYSNKSRYMTKSICKCKWNNNFKEEMKKVEQRHYEQSGYIKGNIVIDGKKEEFILPGGRDHSFGLRDWNAMYDHIWLLGVNDKGEIFNYSLVNYPLLKNIHNGYTDLNKNEIGSLDKINKLTYSPNNGLGLDEFDLEIKFIDKSISKIHVKRDVFHETHYQNGDYYFQEGLGEFLIGNEKLYGSIEFGFNKDKKKWGIKSI